MGRWTMERYGEQNGVSR